MQVLRTGLALLLCVMAMVVHAELTFPALTGRVVDDAHMIQPAVASD